MYSQCLNRLQLIFLCKDINVVFFFPPSGTRSFVSGLFEALKTKSYINSSSNGMSCVTVAPPSSSQGATNNYQNNNILNQSNHSSTSAPQPPPKSDRKRKIPDGSDAVSFKIIIFWNLTKYFYWIYIS